MLVAAGVVGVRDGADVVVVVVLGVVDGRCRCVAGQKVHVTDSLRRRRSTCTFEMQHPTSNIYLG